MTSDQKTGLVTGSTHGVGRLVAHGLANAGFHVVLHGRDETEGRRLVDEIERDGASASFHRADFASLRSVRKFAETIRCEHRQLKLLINNAGVGFGAPGAPREISADGYELRFAVNYLAPFLLTHLLTPVLIASTPARIVNVASLGQLPLDLDDLMFEHDYDGVQAYRRSKLALVMFTFDIADDLRGRGVTANCLHPATFMDTGMVHEAQIEPQSSPEEGADAILHLALAEGLRDVSGAFFDGERRADPDPQASDLEVRRKLRAVSLELTGLNGGSPEGIPSRHLQRAE